MSTEDSSLGWSDLGESRPISSSNSSNSSSNSNSNSSSNSSSSSSSSNSSCSDGTTVRMSPKQTQTMTTQCSDELTMPSVNNISDKLADNRNVRDTYIIYSVGNSTLFLGSLDPQFATERQLELLDRHLLDVKIAEPIAPLWPNPSVLTMGMRTMAEYDLPSTSSAAKSTSAALKKRRLHAKSKCLKVYGQKKRINRVHIK